MAHAFALLLEEREVLVEHALADGAVIRETAWLGGGGEADAPLLVTPEGRRQRWSELPDGTAVVLIVPVMHRRWRFITRVAHGAGGAAVLDWPSEIEQVIGRVAARATIALAVEVRERAVGGEFPPRPVCTYTLDVSMSGVQLVLPTLHARGTRLELSVRMPRARRSVLAEVMWASAPDEPQDPLHRTGLGFEKPSPIFTHELRELLASAAPAAKPRPSGGGRTG